MTLPAPLNLTVFGDAGVGKTALLLSFTLNLFSSTSLPTCIEGLVAKVENETKSYEVHLYDTPGDDFDRVCLALYPKRSERHFIRPLHPPPDIILVCYSVTSSTTFQNVTRKWAAEINKRLPGTPWLLVGTKIDQRNNAESSLTRADGVAVAETLGAVGYVECSSFTQVGVKEVLEEAAMAARKPEEKKTKKGSCLIQ